MSEDQSLREILTGLVSAKRKLSGAIWLEGTANETGAPDNKILVVPDSSDLAGTVMEFDKEDILSIEKGASGGSDRVAVRAGSVYVLHIVTTLTEPSPSQTGEESTSQKLHGHAVTQPKINLGDWVLSQRSHGHAIAAPAIPRASQRSHGHAVTQPEIDLSDWVLSQRSHGHRITPSES